MKIIPYNSCQVPEGLHLRTPQVTHDFYTSMSPTPMLMDRHCLSSLWTSQHLCHFLFTTGCSALQRGLCWLGDSAFEKFHCFFFFLLLNFGYGKQRTGKTSEVFQGRRKSKKEVVVVCTWESPSCGTRESDLRTDVWHAQPCFTLLTSTSLMRYCIMRCTPNVMY